MARGQAVVEEVQALRDGICDLDKRVLESLEQVRNSARAQMDVASNQLRGEIAALDKAQDQKRDQHQCEAFSALEQLESRVNEDLLKVAGGCDASLKELRLMACSSMEALETKVLTELMHAGSDFESRFRDHSAKTRASLEAMEKQVGESAVAPLRSTVEVLDAKLNYVAHALNEQELGMKGVHASLLDSLREVDAHAKGQLHKMHSAMEATEAKLSGDLSRMAQELTLLAGKEDTTRLGAALAKDRQQSERLQVSMEQMDSRMEEEVLRLNDQNLRLKEDLLRGAQDSEFKAKEAADLAVDRLPEQIAKAIRDYDVEVLTMLDAHKVRAQDFEQKQQEQLDQLRCAVGALDSKLSHGPGGAAPGLASAGP